ncbi:MAG: signal peptidase I [Oscillospiraceae bacterium]|jgi:signal peptidase|nr:signal peptidase I [Oscillospiraceae bacterium]
MRKGWLLNIIVILAVLTLVGAVIFICSGNARESFVFGYKPVLITSSSMEPEYRIGGFAIVRQREITDVERKDVILFRNSNGLILHRVVDADEGELTTQGDTLGIPDGEPVVAENLLGKVVWHTNLTAGWTWQRAAIWVGAIMLLAIAIRNMKYLKELVAGKANKKAQ